MKKTVFILICFMAVLAVLPLQVSADTGPKPSVHVNVIFENMDDVLCYGTLLSEKPQWGPYQAYGYPEGVEDDIYGEDYESVIAGYKDTDGYYVLRNMIFNVGESKSISWTYFPPDKFKILLSFPDSGVFAVSGVCERYAFDTYYTVNMDGTDIISAEYNEELSSDRRIVAERSYDFATELISLAARILITLAIEILVALLFGYRGKKALWFIIAVNAVTQIILNVLLNVIGYKLGLWAFVIAYVLLELAVFGIEALLCCLFMNKLTERQKPAWFHVLYSLAANASSFVIGLIIAAVIPALF